MSPVFPDVIENVHTDIDAVKLDKRLPMVGLVTALFDRPVLTTSGSLVHQTDLDGLGGHLKNIDTETAEGLQQQGVGKGPRTALVGDSHVGPVGRHLFHLQIIYPGQRRNGRTQADKAGDMAAGALHHHLNDGTAVLFLLPAGHDLPGQVITGQ